MSGDQRISSFLTGLFLACFGVFSAYAQDVAAPMAEGPPPKPAPNLTVNVTLNSVLDDEQTAYYAELAERLIASLPRELKAAPPPGNVTLGDEHLNVVTYLPSLADDPHQTGLDKRIQYFKVKFDFDGSGAAPKATIMSQSPAFVAGTPMISQTLDEGDLSVAAILQDPKEAAAEPEIPVVETDSGMVVVGAGKVTRDAEAAKEAAEKRKRIADVKAAGGKAGPTPENTISKTPTEKAVPVTPNKGTYASNNPDQLHLVYRADALELDDMERKKLLDFVKKSRATEGVIGYNVVVRTNKGPFGDLDWLGDERVRLLGGLMRQLGVDIYSRRLNEIHVTTQSEQFIQIEQIRG